MDLRCSVFSLLLWRNPNPIVLYRDDGGLTVRICNRDWSPSTISPSEVQVCTIRCFFWSMRGRTTRSALSSALESANTGFLGAEAFSPLVARGECLANGRRQTLETKSTRPPARSGAPVHIHRYRPLRLKKGACGGVRPPEPLVSPASTPRCSCQGRVAEALVRIRRLSLISSNNAAGGDPEATGEHCMRARGVMAIRSRGVRPAASVGDYGRTQENVTFAVPL